MGRYKVDNAIILAAGFGSRFVPLTYETPKGLLEVKGTPMLERQIEQLIEKGINEIIIVVGYMKERFDYLIDKYNAKLIYNPEFSTKNNLASLYYARDYLKNSYVLVADNWIERNIFNEYEPHSWFSCLYMEGKTAEWCVTKSDEEGLIQEITIGGSDSWVIVGPAFFTESFSAAFRDYLIEYYQDPRSADFYWEHILKERIAELPMYINKQQGNVYEFENLEELRQYDKSYENDTKCKIMKYISDCFGVTQDKIRDIFPLKAGVTNFSFVFTLFDKKYVFRLPGIGTDKLINRHNEKRAYDATKSLNITDEVVHFDADSGIKITKFYEGARIADPFNDDDLAVSMCQLRKIHENRYQVSNRFDISNMIDYYYSLAKDINAIRFSDVDQVREKLDKLLRFREQLAIPEILCHGDFAHTNVLLLPDGSSKIIDWEYSGMSDPIMDVSMYAIYAEFDRERIDLSLDLYLQRQPSSNETARLYLYVALGGFLWSMWSQYKQGLGQEFGEYPLKMYRYMKDFYRIMVDEGLFSPEGKEA